MHPANERRRYIVTSSHVGWAHTHMIPDLLWFTFYHCHCSVVCKVMSLGDFTVSRHKHVLLLVNGMLSKIISVSFDYPAIKILKWISQWKCKFNGRNHFKNVPSGGHCELGELNTCIVIIKVDQRMLYYRSKTWAFLWTTGASWIHWN